MTLEELVEYVKTIAQDPHGSSESDYCDFPIHSPLLGADIRVSVFLDQPIKLGLSERQQRQIHGFVQMQGGLNLIKQALYDHWENNNDYWAVEVEVNDANHAYDLSKLSSLMIMSVDGTPWEPDECQLRFEVPWDPEHGAGVIIKNGRVTGFGDL